MISYLGGSFSVGDSGKLWPKNKRENTYKFDPKRSCDRGVDGVTAVVSGPTFVL
jgi:hypothetical protein